MTLKAAAGGFVIFLLSVPVIQGQDDRGVTYTSTEICALKGSTVNIPCTFTYPSTGSDNVEKRSWIARGSNRAPVDVTTDSHYAGRVTYPFHENDCTLRINDLRESDSAEYNFRFMTDRPDRGFTGSPGVLLSVTDLRVQVGRSELRCHSRYGPKLPSVSVSPSAEIVEGSSVTLTCSSDANPAASYTWYKQDVNPDPRPLSEEPQLVFSSIQSSDSGQYYCRAENQLGMKRSEFISIDVEYGPKLPSVSVSPSAEIVEGSSVTLTCSSDANPAASYTWNKKGHPDPRPLSEEPQLVFSSIQSSDSGEYYCTAANELGKASEYISIDVKDGPKLPSVSVSPSAEIVEGSSVNLTCSSDANPAANYTWYKENQTTLSEEPQLVFSSIQSSDSGQYYCRAENVLGKKRSEFISIDVKCEFSTLHLEVITHHLGVIVFGMRRCCLVLHV
ncbi:B-cell receptor CD22-like [Lycodopsis pacificus]